MKTLDDYLATPVDWNKVNELGYHVFYLGELDRLEELFLLVVPIVHMTYYQHLVKLDDRGYAKEDLIQDALLEIYKDMSLRWDKFIDVIDYYSYFKTISKNVMVTLVHQHHSYYSNVEFDPDVRSPNADEVRYSYVEAKCLKQYFTESMLTLTRRLASCHTKYAKALDYLITWKYVEKKTDTNQLKSMMRVFGLTRAKVNFLLDHIQYLHRLSFNYYKAQELGEIELIQRMDAVFSRFDSDTYRVLSKNYGDTIIPEIFAEFGPEITKRFVKIFSDKQVFVPNYTHFCDDLFGVKLLTMVNDKDELYELSTNYRLDYGTLSRIYDRAVKNRDNI